MTEQPIFHDLPEDTPLDADAYCRECQKHVAVEGENEGIGVYEFWGSKSVDVNWVYRCAECGSDEIYNSSNTGRYEPDGDPPDGY